MIGYIGSSADVSGLILLAGSKRELWIPGEDNEEADMIIESGEAASVPSWLKSSEVVASNKRVKINECSKLWDPTIMNSVQHPTPHSQISANQGSAAAESYNAQTRSNRNKSHETFGYHSRKLNNWIKSLLIHLNGKGGGNVLDLACGNGGDVAKWSGVGVGGFVGVDVADKRLEEALRR